MLQEEDQALPPCVCTLPCQIVEGLPRAVAADETGTADEPGEWEGAAQPEGELSATNQQTLQLGLLQVCMFVYLSPVFLSGFPTVGAWFTCGLC